MRTTQLKFKTMQELLEFACFIRDAQDYWLRVISYDADEDVLYLEDEDTGDTHEIENASIKVSATEVNVLCEVQVEEE